MTSQRPALTNQRPLFHTRYFCYTIEKFHGTFHTCMYSYVEDFIRVCKIPWIILHNDTGIQILHAWKITRMKIYAYEKLHVWKVTRIEYWALIGALLSAYSFFLRNFWYVLRSIHVTFYTCNLWRILSTSANHTYSPFIDTLFSTAHLTLTHWGLMTHICICQKGHLCFI